MRNPFTRILAIGALAATLVCGLTPSAQALTLPVTSVRDVAGTAPADPVHWRRWGWGGYGYGWRRPYYGYGWRRPYYYGYYRPWRPVYYRPLYYRPVVYRRAYWRPAYGYYRRAYYRPAYYRRAYYRPAYYRRGYRW